MASEKALRQTTKRLQGGCYSQVLQVWLKSEPEQKPPGAPKASLIDKFNSHIHSCGAHRIKLDETAASVFSEFKSSLRIWGTNKEEREKSTAEGQELGHEIRILNN